MTPLASQRLPTRRDGSAHSEDGDAEDGDAAHKCNKDGDKEKEKKRRTRNGCLVCRKRKKVQALNLCVGHPEGNT